MTDGAWRPDEGRKSDRPPLTGQIDVRGVCA